MKKYITALGLALALGIGASVAAEPEITLESLVAKLPDTDKTAAQQKAIANEAYKNPAFYAQLKAADWTFEGVKLVESRILAAQRLNKDWEAISGDGAASGLDIASYKSWVAYHVGQKGETLAAYDWLQAQRLAALGAAVPTSGEKVEFLDALAAQILAAAKARGN